MLSTPLIACSSGDATVSAITFGFAPGYVARTTTVGGTTSGYSATGSLKSAMAPAIVMNAHRSFLGSDGHPGTNALQTIHDDELAGLQAFAHDAQAIANDGPELHRAI